MQGFVWLCVLAILSVGLHFQELAPGTRSMGCGCMWLLVVCAVLFVCAFFALFGIFFLCLLELNMLCEYVMRYWY